MFYGPDDGGVVRWGKQPFGNSGGLPPTAPTGFLTRHRFANENHPFIIWYCRGTVGTPTPPTPTPTPPPLPTGTTIGGIGEYSIEFPHAPKEPPRRRFKRNTENLDRQDIADIVRILAKGGFL